MTDAIALLAISQLVCLAGLAYLYTQLQALRRQAPARIVRRGPSRVRELPDTVGVERRAADRVAAQTAYGANARAPRETVASLAARAMSEGVDVGALARRLNRSEEEVRLLLRRQGAGR
jgi:hypothetical protein